ncbi:MAG: thioredoxin family protein [Flavobacteriaceae bacterium]|nr:thioredoxin family protein [Flavobacteriaceae bacterium]
MKLLVFILGLNIFWINAQNIEWLTFEAALEAQRENPKKILMDVYTDWCGPCKLMDKKTFQNKDVAAYISEHYYAVKFNAEGKETISFFGNSFTNPNYDPNRKGRNATHQFTQFLGVKGYPTVIFISETGDLITPLVGYQNPQQIELYLKMIKQGDYMIFSKPDDFEKYKKSFRPRFRG